MTALRTAIDSCLAPLERLPRRRYLLILTALLALTRVAALWFYADLSNPDLLETGTITRNILAGHGYSINFRAPVPEEDLDPAETPRPMPTAFTLPGYVAITTAVLGVFGDGAAGYAALYAVSLLATIAAGVLLFFLARRLFGERCARLAALLFAVHPPAIAIVSTFGGGPVYQLVICLGMLAAVRADETGRNGDFLAAGLAGGVWLLFRAEALALAALFAVWFARRHGARKAAAYFAVVVLCALPWSIRNYATFDSFVPLTSNGWLNIWRGNNPEATGGSWHTDGSSNWFDRRQTLVGEFKKLPVTDRYELDVMAIYRERALDFIFERPMQALSLYGKKFLMFLTVETSDKRVYQLPLSLPNLLLSALTVAGFVTLLRRRRGPALLLIAVAFYWFFIPLFHVETRYQIMLSVLYAPIASALLIGIRRASADSAPGGKTGLPD